MISGTRGLEVLSDPLYSTFVPETPLMTHPIKEFFTDSEWDLIYNLVENNRQFCDDDEYDPVEDYNTVLTKIRGLFEETK